MRLYILYWWKRVQSYSGSIPGVVVREIFLLAVAFSEVLVEILNWIRRIIKVE